MPEVAARAASSPAGGLAGLAEEIAACRACPRLVDWREQVARERRAAFRAEAYWGRAVPGFGDPRARILVLGLAPAAHGANRTGRYFTGDRSGDFLFAGLHRAGLASSPVSRVPEDGMVLRDCWITASVRCAPPANRPLPAERDACTSWLVRELALLESVRLILCLGAFAWDAALRLRAAAGDPAGSPKPRFGHGAVAEGRLTMLGCFHPSQQNTFTGKLTPEMLDATLAAAVAMAGPTRGAGAAPG